MGSAAIRVKFPCLVMFLEVNRLPLLNRNLRGGGRIFSGVSGFGDQPRAFLHTKGL